MKCIMIQSIWTKWASLTLTSMPFNLTLMIRTNIFAKYDFTKWLILIPFVMHYLSGSFQSINSLYIPDDRKTAPCISRPNLWLLRRGPQVRFNISHFLKSGKAVVLLGLKVIYLIALFWIVCNRLTILLCWPQIKEP